MAAVVDSQVHIWDAVKPGMTPQRPEPFRCSELLPLMDEAHVDRAILVTPTWDPAGNAATLSAAKEHPTRFAVMGILNWEADGGPVSLDGWLDTPGMLGIRIGARREPLATWLVDGTMDWLWDAAKEANIPIMLYPPGRLGVADALARSHPELRLVIDHMGIASSHTKASQMGPELNSLVELAKYPNVAVKISALPSYSELDFPFRDMHGIVRRLVDVFGPERCFWGTDLSRLECSYVEAVEMVTQHLPDLSPEEVELVMGEAILAWLGWP